MFFVGDLNRGIASSRESYLQKNTRGGFCGQPDDCGCVCALSLPSKRGDNDSDATNNQSRPVDFRKPAALPSALPLARACRSSPRTPQAPPLPPPSTLESLQPPTSTTTTSPTPWTSQTDGRLLLLPQTSPDSGAPRQTVGSGGRPLLWLVCTAATGRPSNAKYQRPSCQPHAPL